MREIRVLYCGILGITEKKRNTQQQNLPLAKEERLRWRIKSLSKSLTATDKEKRAAERRSEKLEAAFNATEYQNSCLRKELEKAEARRSSAEIALSEEKAARQKAEMEYSCAMQSSAAAISCLQAQIEKERAEHIRELARATERWHAEHEKACELSAAIDRLRAGRIAQYTAPTPITKPRKGFRQAMTSLFSL